MANDQATFFVKPLACGITPASTGRLQVWAQFKAGGQQVIWTGNLPMSDQEPLNELCERGLQVLGFDLIGCDFNRIQEIPGLNREVKLTIKPRTDGTPGLSVFLNDPNEAPRFREAAQSDVQAATERWKRQRSGQTTGPTQGGNRNPGGSQAGGTGGDL